MFLFFVSFKSAYIQELKSTNETLKMLQKELEKAYEHSRNVGSGPAGCNIYTNSTLTAILETKEARITTLEKEVDLLEKELSRIREYTHFSATALGGTASALGGHFDFLERPNSPPVHDFSGGLISSMSGGPGGFSVEQYRKQVRTPSP